jgi:Tfp pilus assembly protein PilN
MRAVNLIPGDSRRGGFNTGLSLGPAYAVLGVLAVAVGLMTLYVLTNNTISKRQSEIATIQAQVSEQRAEAARLANYVRFAQLAAARAKTVREIATTRFDWHSALADLSKVVPSNTSLETLSGSTAPQATVSGGGGGSGSALRADIAVPAIEVTGCSKTQDEVAQLMSRLRVINGVTRVTLSDSIKNASSSGSAGPAGGCGNNAPSFDIVVFFKPLQGVDPTTGSPDPAGSSTTTSGGAQ